MADINVFTKMEQFEFYSGAWSSYLTELLSLRVVEMVGAKGTVGSLYNRSLPLPEFESMLSLLMCDHKITVNYFNSDPSDL